MVLPKYSLTQGGVLVRSGKPTCECCGPPDGYSDVHCSVCSGQYAPNQIIVTFSGISPCFCNCELVPPGGSVFDFIYDGMNGSYVLDLTTTESETACDYYKRIEFSSGSQPVFGYSRGYATGDCENDCSEPPWTTYYVTAIEVNVSFFLDGEGSTYCSIHLNVENTTAPFRTLAAFTATVEYDASENCFSGVIADNEYGACWDIVTSSTIVATGGSAVI